MSHARDGQAEYRPPHRGFGGAEDEVAGFKVGVPALGQRVPAIGDGRLYIRTEKSLWSLGDKNSPVP